MHVSLNNCLSRLTFPQIINIMSLLSGCTVCVLILKKIFLAGISCHCDTPTLEVHGLLVK
jgi:hypothetical protein